MFLHLLFIVLRLEIEFREQFGHFLVDLGAHNALKWVLNIQKM